jgi:hypothetical protein
VKISKCRKSAGKTLNLIFSKLQMIKPEDANYIVGFVDGEGSFNISFIKRSDYKYNIKISPSFNISQKDKGILEWIQSVFNCGTIRDRGDGVFYYEVQDINSLKEVIIPFFNKYHLRTKKNTTFQIFSKIVELIDKGNHLNKDGILEIYDLRERIVVARKRKYKREEIENILSKS